MNSKFIVSIRRAVRALPSNEKTVRNIMNLGHELVKDVEGTIFRDQEIGKRRLKHNIEEIEAEQGHVEMKVRSCLEELEKKGLDEYDTDFAFTKEIALIVEDILSNLNDLWKVYFAEHRKSKESKNRHLNGKTFIQNAEKIYNIDKIDKADFS